MAKAKSYKELIPDDEISLDDAVALTREHRKLAGLKQSPAFFIPIHAIRKLTGALGLDGIKIYTGYKKGPEKTPFVLIIGAVIEKDPNKGCDLYVDVTQYAYSINGAEPVDAPRTVIVKSRVPPCPPPTDGCHTSILNTDSVTS
ncbi:MAG: hypothetical protein ABI861_08175 [Panacibacter sp.]